LRPSVFRLTEHSGDEGLGAILRCALSGSARPRRIGISLVRRAALERAKQDSWVDPQPPGDEKDGNDGANTQPTAADAKAARAGAAAPSVLDIAAAAKIVPTHGLSLP